MDMLYMYWMYVFDEMPLFNVLFYPQKPLEGQHSFEQKLHLMLQRIGVSKAQPEETQVSVHLGLRSCCLF